MGKITETRQLYKEVIDEISKDKESWQKFLDCSSWNFKYDFDDQVLIYAQRPDAKACASMEEWNKKLRRWVNKDTKPIFIFEKNPFSEYPFRLVFDISDTHNRENTKYNLWSVNSNYEKEIINSLEASFGDIPEKENLAQAITLVSYNMVVDNLEDYLESILNNKSNTSLENMTIEDIKLILTTTVWPSISYMMMTRCGINAIEYVDIQGFENIKYFNSPESLSILGACISDIAEMGLREIAKTVRSLEKNEKIKNRTFEKEEKEMYSKINNNKGGMNYEQNRIQENRRLSDTEFNDGERKNSVREIRLNEIQLFEKPQELRVNNISNEQEVNETFRRSTENSEDKSKPDNTTDGRDGWSKRNNEIRKSNEMDRANEQLQDDSRGNSNQRTNLYLENNGRRYISKEEQKSERNFLKDKFVCDLLSNVENLKVSRTEIKDFYKLHSDINERTEYIKNIFNDAYTEIVIEDERIGYKTYENVLHLWKGKYLNRDEEVYYKWEIIAKFIEGLILVNEFNDIHKTIPSYNEQLELIQSGAKEASDFLFTQEVIDYALQLGGNTQQSKMRIYNQFKKSLSSKENINFLKKEYGWGGSSSILAGTQIGISYDGKGIKLTRGFKENSPKTILNWNTVEKRIGELIKADKYLNEKEKENYEKWLEQKDIIKIEELPQTLNNEIPEYEYRLGDIVYIGSDKYEYLGVKDNIVSLLDEKFPLMNKQMEFEEFDKKVKENYANEHLIKKNRDDIENENIIESIPVNINNDNNVKEEKKIDFKPIPKSSSKIQSFDLHPNVDINNRHNYKIKDKNLGIGTPKEKFERNINAIRVLRKCEEENRYATLEEQEILAKYVGWGGLQQAFDSNNTSWANEYKTLKELLTPEEYNKARQSVLTAYYTPPVVIETMYKALKNMGLKEANILEPSCRNR